MSRAARLAEVSALRPEHSGWWPIDRLVGAGGRRRHRSARGLCGWAVWSDGTVLGVVGSKGPLRYGPAAPERPCNEGECADEARVWEDATCVACARGRRLERTAATMMSRKVSMDVVIRWGGSCGGGSRPLRSGTLSQSQWPIPAQGYLQYWRIPALGSVSYKRVEAAD